ncbi:hypothetical protein [Escherichia coli]|uniref:hypothetical protein n=1 Tax=Escherichia coli TaxID=562 RepID=UPI0020238761|nr:hypothetical protein [Escherichia coli]
MDDKLYSALNNCVRNAVQDIIYEDFKDMNLLSLKVSNSDFQTIKVQFRALGLIIKSEKSRSVKDKGTYWTLTPYGENLMTTLRAIKKTLV